jgi:hypothetical protein
MGPRLSFGIWNQIEPFTSPKLLFKSSGSQPGVCVPLGVREQFAGGTPNFKSTQN